jgi:hypothetical protein
VAIPAGGSPRTEVALDLPSYPHIKRIFAGRYDNVTRATSNPTRRSNRIARNP